MHDPEIRILGTTEGSECRRFLDEGSDLQAPAGPWWGIERRRISVRSGNVADVARREPSFGRLVGQGRQAQLPQATGALHPPGRFAGRLHRRQQGSDQRGDDRDHHQEFDEAKAGSRIRTA